MSSRILPAALCAAALACAAASSAQAHIVIDPREAPAGSYFKGTFRVSHGCMGAATVAVTVSIPPGILSVRPQPKAGWTVTIEREKLAQPVAGPHGHTIDERVARVTWRGGPLPDEFFDEFALQLKLPGAAPDGFLNFPVRQQCETGERDWSDIPGPGQAWHELKSPAPRLRLIPKK